MLHVGDRLSAYLDGELPVADRGSVDEHLRICAECARRLEELAAVDAAARALPVSAPPGYFEALPARVRARLKAHPHGGSWRPPIWSWALAAALLLAVVTPATLLRQAAPRPEAARPAPHTRLARPTPEPRTAAPAAERDDKLEVVRSLGYVGSARAPALAQKQADKTPLPPRPSATIPGPHPQAGRAGGRTREQQPSAPVSTEARDAAEPPGEFAPHPAEEFAGAQAVRSNDEADQPSADKPERSEAKQKREERSERRREAAVAAAPALAAAQAQAWVEARYAGLLAKGAPGSIAEARAMREAWRAFVRDFPAAPRADEARVRAIEAGAELYRRSKDPRDLEAVRDDAVDYLKRDDATQPERVQAVLQALER